MMRFDVMPSPVGELMLVASDTHLAGVHFTPHPDGEVASGTWERASGGTAADAILAEARAQLTERRETAEVCPLG